MLIILLLLLPQLEMGEFTFGDGTGSGVTVEAAENFLKSLEFGINSDEPTGWGLTPWMSTWHLL